ncbi:MAG: hypothetical protein NDI61_07825 [Bdellovibrionaceae bacterium]|nr:hypothetical protein [Pseudobdellovibrionaceae bacterium]
MLPSFPSLSPFHLALTLLITIAATSARAAVELPPWKWKPGYWRVTTQAVHFSSDANYDSARGAFVRLPPGHSFSLTSFGLRARYNLNPRWSFFSGGEITQATAKDSSLERDNSALSNVYVGANAIVMQGWLRLIGELEALYSTDPIDIDTTDALTNDGVHHVRGSLFAFKPFRLFTVYAHGGLKYRDEGLATLALWGAGLEKPLFQRFLLGVGLEGYETVVNDELPAANRTSVTNRANAGSQTFFAHDPALLEARAWAGWSPVNAWQIRAGYGQSLDGVRSAAGQTLFVNVSYNFDPKPSRESFQAYRAQRAAIRKKSRQALEDFKVDSEKSDPDLFDPDDGFEPDVEPDPLSETERLLESE